MFNLSHDDNETSVARRRPFVQSNTRALNRGRELKILWDVFRSRMAKLSFPYDRTIVIDRRIADDRRPYCDLRSAIIWKPALKTDEAGSFQSFEAKLKLYLNA